MKSAYPRAPARRREFAPRIVPSAFMAPIHAPSNLETARDV
jgi:hypothetical protein